jgi:hypothetical protein
MRLALQSLRARHCLESGGRDRELLLVGSKVQFIWDSRIPLYCIYRWKGNKMGTARLYSA